MLFLALAPGQLATAAAEPDSVSLAEVTVTAIKQNADLRTQSVSATTLARTAIERQGVMDVKAATVMAPNVFIPDYGSRMTSTIYVRGIGTRIDQPAVGLNIDNVPVLTKENYDVDLLDISRVEVLRGPQSTLYGRNTMGGLMNVYTLSPLNYSGTRLLATYGSHGSVRAGLSHYARLNSRVGLAASAYYTGTGGEFTNQYNGHKADWEHQGSGRVKLEWLPGENWRVSNVLSLSISRQGGYPYRWLQTGQIAYNDTCFYRRTAIIDGLTVTRQFSKFTLSSITSWQYLCDNMTLDQDFTPQPYFTLTQDRKENAFTQDLVARHHDDHYECLTGLFGFYRHYNMDAPVTFKDYGISQLIESHRNQALPTYPIAWDSRQFLLGSHFSSPSWGAAFYHQSTYRWRRLRFAAGLRLDYEHAQLRYHSFTHTGYSTLEAATGLVYVHQNIDIDDRDQLKKDFLQLLPRFSVTLDLPTRQPSSVYMSVTKGYKSGGFNTQMFSDVLQQRLMKLMGIGASYNVNQIVGYKPEKAWNYELGGHFECWHGRVKSDLALFYMDCRDRQLTVFPDGTTTGRVMTNAGKTRSWGGEIALNVMPCTGTGVTVSYGYTNACFVDYNDGKADYKDKHVPYAPANTLFAQVHHSFNLQGDPQKFVDVSVDVSGVGKIWWNEANTVGQSFYALLGASATLHWRHCEVQLWGKNLTDTRYSTFYFVSIGHEFLQRGHGCHLGGTLRINL